MANQIWYPTIKQLSKNQDYCNNIYKYIVVSRPKWSQRQDKYIKEYTFFKNHKDILNMVNSTEEKFKRYDEVTLSYTPQKFKYDIDLKIKEFEKYKEQGIISENTIEEFINTIIKNLLGLTKYTITEILNLPPIIENDIVICSTKNPLKKSIHIIFNGFYFENHVQAKRFYDYVIYKYLEIYNEIPSNILKEIVDSAVYKSTQNFRIINCSKPGQENIKKLQTNHNELDTFITFIRPEDKLIDDILLHSLPSIYNKNKNFTSYNNKPVNKSELTDLLNVILVADSYQEWYTVGQTIYNIYYENGKTNEDYYLNIFHNYSMKSEKYDEDEVTNHWNNLKYNDNLENKLTIHTLRHIAKQQNPNKYWDWYNEYYSLSYENNEENDYEFLHNSKIEYPTKSYNNY